MSIFKTRRGRVAALVGAAILVAAGGYADQVVRTGSGQNVGNDRTLAVGIPGLNCDGDLDLFHTFVIRTLENGTG